MQILVARLSIANHWPLTILILLHAVGALGLSSSFAIYFQQLTPINLLISAIILGVSSSAKNAYFYFFIISTFILGFAAEWIGVRYEWLFGTYSYGQTLGWKIANVPVIIGINWFLIIYSVGNIMNLFDISKLLKITFGASLAVLLDIFIEPVAIYYDFWSWENTTPPLQNYIGWFIVSFVMLLIFFNQNEKESNKNAIAFYFIQLIFFVILNLRLLIFN
jgi:bisanhydrobacterioruberin hydratase